MGREEFVIRITRKGEIIVEVDGMPVQRVKDLRDYLEEMLGPVREIEPDDGSGEGRLTLDEQYLAQAGSDEAEETQSDHDRLRLRDDG